jgi:hypothetical protein
MVMKAPTQPETFTIAAGEFKARCLKLMDEAVVTQRSFAITKRGKRVGKFVPEPPEESPFRSLFGRSPHLRVPSEAEWRKLKDEWAGEWERSTKNLVREIDQRSSKRKGSRK